MQRGRVHEQASLFADDIQRDLQSRIPALQRIVNRWQARGGTPEYEFGQDANYYIRDMPGFQAIAWADSSFHVRWVIPLFGNEKAVGLNLGIEKKRRVALEAAKSGRIPVMTHPVELVQGDMGLIVYFPIFLDKKFDGFVLAVLNTQDWLNYVLRANERMEHLKDVSLSVEMEGETIFTRSNWEETKETKYDATITRSTMFHPITIRCKPTVAFLAVNSSLLPEAAMGIGMVLVLLATFVVYFFKNPMPKPGHPTPHSRLWKMRSRNAGWPRLNSSNSPRDSPSPPRRVK